MATSRCTNLYKKTPKNKTKKNKQTNRKQTNVITENKWEKKQIKTREIEASNQCKEIKQILPTPSLMKVLIKN